MLHPAGCPSIVSDHEAESPTARDGPGHPEIVSVPNAEELFQRFAHADPEDVGPTRIDLLADLSLFLFREVAVAAPRDPQTGISAHQGFRTPSVHIFGASQQEEGKPFGRADR